MLRTNSKQFFTREFTIRLVIVILIGVSYLYLIRPGRAILSQEWIRPVAEKYVEMQPEELMLAGATTSVSFTVFIINEEKTDFSHEITFGFPFGFFFFAPLLLLILIDFTNRFSAIHIIIQTVLGFLMLILFLAGLSVHLSFLHIYTFIIDYLIPGAAFLVVLFSMIKDNKLVR